MASGRRATAPPGARVLCRRNLPRIRRRRSAGKPRRGPPSPTPAYSVQGPPRPRVTYVQIEQGRMARWGTPGPNGAVLRSRVNVAERTRAMRVRAKIFPRVRRERAVLSRKIPRLAFTVIDVPRNPAHGRYRSYRYYL